MDRALQVRQILSSQGLTLYSVSRQSAEIFGRFSQFHIPHNLYYDLARGLSVPTIFQILALSHITNYRLSDWSAVFGFELDAISRLQMLVLRQQTAVLDSAVYDTYAWIPWLADGPKTSPLPSIAPLGQLLTWAGPKRARDVLALNKRKFLYAIVGQQDLYALPYFLPGSIIRVDVRRVEELPRDHTNREGPFFLVECEFGLTCSRLMRLGNNRVILRCPQRPCAERELDVGRHARILGMVDAEIRPLAADHYSRREIGKSVAPAIPRFAPPPGTQTSLKELLRRSRLRAGLSFRSASSISRLIADTLSDELYFAAASTLSDYEALSLPPRHIQKIITLCVLYCISFERFLRASEFPLERAGQEPIPDALVPRKLSGGRHGLPVAGQDRVPDPNGFLAGLVNEWEEVPLFLAASLNEFTQLKNFSLSDVFWVGGDKAPRHPLLIDATFVVVNRRARKPPPTIGAAVCEQSLYVILSRGGGYLCGGCTLDEGNLIVHGYPGGPVAAEHFRIDTDAQVVGEVTTILRHVL